MRIAMIVLGFLLLSALFIVSNNNLYLLKDADMALFYSSYINWLGGALRNVGSITGHAVNLRWLPSS